MLDSSAEEVVAAAEGVRIRFGSGKNVVEKVSVVMRLEEEEGGSERVWAMARSTL